MNGIVRESFKMTKITIKKSGSVYYEASIQINVDNVVSEMTRKDTIPIIPSDDLLNSIRDLKDKLLNSSRYLGFLTMVMDAEFKATKAQKDATQKLVALLKEKTIVMGVSVSGQDQNEGVIISGKVEADNSMKVAVNSPRLRYTSKVYGWEEDLESEMELIEDELYEYLYKGKKAQLEVFPEE